MPTAIPAMKARLGDTDYFIVSMKAQELVNLATVPKDQLEWDDMTIDERYQRELNENRVKNQIAPYLANDKSRFFGAIILTVMNFNDVVQFEPLADLKKMPALYASAAANMGFLTFTGQQVFVPLDGQHRLRAIKYAITAKDGKDKPIDGIEPCLGLAEDDVTVILVGFEKEKARKIFTRVNRYAKPTTTGQNIITDDDDIIAVLSRKIANNVFTGRLVNTDSNTITPKHCEFTTLSNIYNCNEIILEEVFREGKISKSEPPERKKASLYDEKVEEVWTQLTESIQIFSQALHDTSKEGDEGRRQIKSTNLLGKPAVQECLVRAYMRLTYGATNMRTEEACKRLNNIPWSITDENIRHVWHQLIWAGDAKTGKVITKNRKLAGRVIAYMAGEKLTPDEEAILTTDYLKLFSNDEKEGRKLPVKIL